MLNWWWFRCFHWLKAKVNVWRRAFHLWRIKYRVCFSSPELDRLIWDVSYSYIWTIGLVVDQEKDVSLFLDKMSQAAAQLVHLSRLKKDATFSWSTTDPMSLSACGSNSYSSRLKWEAHEMWNRPIILSFGSWCCCKSPSGLIGLSSIGMLSSHFSLVRSGFVTESTMVWEKT